MTSFILSANATNSLREIRTYSLKNFGTQQTSHYIRKLQERMRRLAEQPTRGKPRNEINVGYYSAFEGSHVIYYRIRETHIEIIDILHQKMDPLLNL